MYLLALDTETALIQPGLSAPPLACISWASGGASGLVDWRAGRAWFKRALDSDSTLVGHNIAYDMGVCCANYPDLLPAVLRAYADGRVLCTLEMQKLADIATGLYETQVKSGGYGLNETHRRHGGALMDKSTWRLRYGELRVTSCDLWPEGAREYALGDAIAPLHIVQNLCARYDTEFPGWRADLPARSRTAFALHLITCHGVRTDLVAVAALEKQVSDLLDGVRANLRRHGLLTRQRNGTYKRDTKAAKARMVQVCAELNVEPKLTDAGDISLDADACKEVADSLLDDYSVWSTQTTLLSKIADMRMGAQIPLQARYTATLATGRTSCSKQQGPSQWGAQMQNPPARLKGFRECFVARPGCALVSVDYSSMESVALGQVVLWITGQSRLAEMINSGVCPHTWFAGVLLGVSYEACAARVAAGEEVAKAARQRAKCCNFGYPGGMGAATFVVFCRAQWGVYITEDEARGLKRIWMGAFPEMRLYFQYVDREITNKVAIRQFVSGRYRGWIHYTAACNTLFQGLGADGALAALWAVTVACHTPASALFGCRVWNFVHDEIIIEVPLARVGTAGPELARIMVEVFQPFTPDVRIRATPEAMLRWSKSACEVYNSAGELVPWDLEV